MKKKLPDNQILADNQATTPLRPLNLLPAGHVSEKAPSTTRTGGDWHDKFTSPLFLALSKSCPILFT